ncbi:hypothetical protein [Streptomyces clavifer]|uniref:hypothetical protein n=1 Tax=Streptomyces clavifer TaxID=68188 RepID=UPI00371AC2C3
MTTQMTFRGPIQELRAFSSNLQGVEGIELVGPHEPQTSVMDDDEFGIDPIGYFTVVYSAHLSAAVTLQIASLIRKQVKSHRKVEEVPPSAKTDTPQEGTDENR